MEEVSAGEGCIVEGLHQNSWLILINVSSKTLCERRGDALSTVFRRLQHLVVEWRKEEERKKLRSLLAKRHTKEYCIGPAKSCSYIM